MSVEYNKNSIYVTPSSVNRESTLVYVRPDDVVNLEFSIDNAKLEISNGDLVFSLPDGKRVVLISMVEIAFGQNPPTLVDANGQQYKIEDIITSLEVVRQTDAVLIITQAENTEKDAEERSAEIISASDQDGSNDSGSPTGGDGEVAYKTDGAPTEKVNPLGVVPGTVQETGIGIYPATPNTDNEAGKSDSDSSLPGDINYSPQNSLDITYFYGDVVNPTGNQTIDGKNFTSYQLLSGNPIRNTEGIIQLAPVSVGDFSDTNGNYYVNARYKDDKIIRSVSIDYSGFKPTSLTITGIPSDISLESTSDASFKLNANGSYTVSKIPPGGDLTFNMVYDAGRADGRVAMNYSVLYFDEFGEAVSFNYNQNIIFKSNAVTGDFGSTDIVFTTNTAGIEVDTSSGSYEDIIVGGGIENTVNTYAGNDYYFAGVGKNTVSLGEGDDIYYGSTGTDIIRGGNGTDTIRFDNHDAGLSGFDSTYYETYQPNQGLSFYFGVDKGELTNIVGAIDPSVFGAFNNNNVFVSTTGGQTVIDFEVFYGTNYKDVFYIDDIGADRNIELWGGGGFDTLDFSLKSSGIILDISSKSYDKYTLNDFGTYKGSSSNDTFYSDVTSDFSGIIIDGGDGDDTLSYSHLTSGIISMANNMTITDGSPAPTTHTNHFLNIETLEGSQGDDVFRGGASVDLNYIGGAGTDELTYGDSRSGVSIDLMSSAVYKISNISLLLSELKSTYGFDTYDNTIENISFTGSADVFYFSDAVNAPPAGTNVLLVADGGNGIDTIDLLEVNNATVLYDATSIIKYSHGSYNFELSNLERVHFGTGDDTFTIVSGFNQSGFIVNGNDGTDTLDFSNLTSSVTFDLSFSIVAMAGFNGSINFSEIENFIGSQNNDIFYVSSETLESGTSSYFLDGGNGIDTLSFKRIQADAKPIVYDATGTDIVITYDGVALSFNYQSIENIEGTIVDDKFIINYNENPADAISINGSDGRDTLELSPSPSGPVTLNLVNNLIGADTIISIEIFESLSDYDDIVTMNKGSYEINAGDDTGTGDRDKVDFSQVSSPIVITFEDDGKILSSVGVSGVSDSILEGFETIIGTITDDTFLLSPNNTSGGDLTYTIRGDGGASNRISFENSTSAITSFTLNYTGTHSFTGAHTVTYNWESIQAFTFTSQDDEIISNSLTGSFTVDGGEGYDIIDYSGLGESIVYQMAQGWVIKGASSVVDRVIGIEEFIGTDYDDTFILTTEPGGDLKILAGNGTDTADLSAITGDNTDIRFNGSTNVFEATITDGSDSSKITLTDIEKIISSNTDITRLIFEDTTTANTYSGEYYFQSNSADKMSYVDFSEISVAITYNLSDWTVNENSGPDIFAADFKLILSSITGVLFTEQDDTIIGSESISIKIDGKGGTDTMDYSSFTTTSMNFNLGTGEYLKINYNLTDVVENVEILKGTTLNDIFSFGQNSSDINSLVVTEVYGGTGTDSISFADITTDSLVYNASSASSVITVGSTVVNISNIYEMEALIATKNDDNFVITGIASDAFSLANITTLDGDEGFDEFDVSSYTVDLTLTFDALGNAAIILDTHNITLRNIDSYKFGTGSDTVIGTLSGSYTFDLGGGNNVLDYSALTVGMVVDFDARTIVKLGVNTDTFTDLAEVASFIASGFSDTFSVSDVSLLSSLSLDGGGTDSSGNSLDEDILFITNSAGSTVDLTGAIGSGVISNIESIKTSTGDDTFILGGEALYKTTAGYFTKIYGGDGTDTASYATSSNSIEYFMNQLYVVRTAPSGTSVIDYLNEIEKIIGSTGDDIFHMDYVGSMEIDGGSSGNDILDFGSLGFNSIDVDVINGKVIFRDTTDAIVSGSEIKFSNIAEIEGTQFSDRIDAANISGTTIAITINGGAGNDKVSFINRATSYTLDLKTSSNIDLGNVTLVSFETVELTSFDDTVEMGALNQSSIDGGAGYDTLDASYVGDSIVVNFLSGFLTKTSGADIYSNQFANFEEVITDTGDDVFILDNNIMNVSTAISSIKMDANTGNDTLDLSSANELTFKDANHSTLSSTSLNLAYTKSTGDDVNAEFDNFNNITIAVNGDFILEIDAPLRTGDLVFIPQSSSDTTTIVFKSSGSAYDIVFDGGTSLVTTSSGGTNASYKIQGVSYIEVEDALNLHYKSSVIADYNIIFANSVGSGSTVDYSSVQFVSSFKVESLDANGMDVKVVKGNSDPITDTTIANESFENVETIIGTKNADRFSLYENTSGQTFVIDLGGGSTPDTVLLNSSTPLDIDVSSGGVTFTGYRIINGTFISGLTDLDDKITVTNRDVNKLEFLGGDGTDTIEYNVPVELQLILTSSLITVLRENSSGSTLEDKYYEFENIILRGNTYANTIFLNEKLSTGQFVIDGGTITTNSSRYTTLILGGYANSVSKGLIYSLPTNTIRDSDVTSTDDAFVAIDNIEHVTLSDQDDTLVFGSSSVNGNVKSVNGLGGTDTIRMETEGTLYIDSGSILGVNIIGFEIIDLAANGNYNLHMSTDVSNTGNYIIKEATGASVGSFDIYYDNYKAAVNFAFVGDYIELTSDAIPDKDLIDASIIGDPTDIVFTSYSDTVIFNIFHITGQSNAINDFGEYYGSQGFDTLVIDYTIDTTSPIGGYNFRLYNSAGGESNSLGSWNIRAQAFFNNSRTYDGEIQAKGFEEVNVTLDDGNTSQVTIEINNRFDNLYAFNLDVKQHNVTLDTDNGVVKALDRVYSLSYDGSGIVVNYSASGSYGDLSQELENVTIIQYTENTSSATTFIYDNTVLNALSTGAASITYYTSSATSLANYNTELSLIGVTAISMEMNTTSFDGNIVINGYTDQDTGTVYNTPIRLDLKGIRDITLSSNDDVFKTSYIDDILTIDLGFGNNTFIIKQASYSSSISDYSIEYVLGISGGFQVLTYTLKADSSIVSTVSGVQTLESDIFSDTITIDNSASINLSYLPGDRQEYIDNMKTGVASSFYGKDSFVTTSSRTGGVLLGSSTFSLSYAPSTADGVTSDPTFGSNTWGLYKQVEINHLRSSFMIEDPMGINSYVLDSSTGAYTIDNNIRISTSTASMLRINGWSQKMGSVNVGPELGESSIGPDGKSYYEVMAEYGDSSDDSYKNNPYIMFYELEVGGGTNNIDYEVPLWIQDTWFERTYMHLVETTDGRLMLNITTEPDSREIGNKALVSNAGGHDFLIDTADDMRQTAYNTANLVTIYADNFENIIGPSMGYFSFSATFDAFIKSSPFVSSGDARGNLSNSQSSYGYDAASLYDISDTYMHFVYGGTSDGLSFSYGTNSLDVDYSQTYFFSDINQVTLEINATSFVKFSLYAQMLDASSVSRFTTVSLSYFSQESILDYSNFSVSRTSALTMTIQNTAPSDQLPSGGVQVLVDPTGYGNEKMGGTNFGTVYLPEAYSNVNIAFNANGITVGFKFYTSEVSPATNYAVTYSNTDILITNFGSSGNSYTQVERYNDSNSNGVVDSGELIATDYYYFDIFGSGIITKSVSPYVDADTPFKVSKLGVENASYNVGSASQDIIDQKVSYIFDDNVNNTLIILGAETNSSYNLGHESNGDTVVNASFTELHIGKYIGVFTGTTDTAITFGNGSDYFYVGGADLVKAEVDTDYSFYRYADISVIATDYYESITLYSLDAQYDVTGDGAIDFLDYSNIHQGLTFNLSNGNGYVSDNYDGSHSARIGEVQNIRGSLDNDSFQLDSSSGFEIDGSDGIDVVSISNIEKTTTAKDLAESLDNIEILEISNIEQDVFEITVEDIINMTDENNKLVIKTEDEDTILQIISSNSDYLLTANQDANGNDIYSIYSSSDPSQQIGEVTVVKDYSNSNNI